MVVAISIMNVSFILAEMPGLSRAHKEVLSAAVFVGMLFGGVVCGYFADKVGRKPCLIVSLSVNFVASAFVGLSPDLNW